MFTVIVAAIIAGFVAFAVTEYKEPTPIVADFAQSIGLIGDYKPVELTYMEVRDHFGKYKDIVYVVKKDEKYKVPRAHTVHELAHEHWCTPHQNVAKFEPIGWSNREYAVNTSLKMDGWTFGVAWSFDNSEKVINVGLVENYDGEIKVAFYDPKICSWQGSPGEKLGMIIGNNK